ncbi:MAG: hypothetical protein HQ581_08395 [Planctomycetes bacterium]|nr:hypothetical protein [Planctomycetota bacterium]
MSMFENGRYTWRETYFVLFESGRRPIIDQLKAALEGLGKGFVLTNVTADEDNRIESISVLAPDDFAALDICYLTGEEVLEQRTVLLDEMQASAETDEERRILTRIRGYDARFDVLHFEHTADTHEDPSDAEDPEELEMLNPGALLSVLELLGELTGGIAVDPQTCTVL